jgi:XTP/dITP diphosphohydrolase
MDRLILLATSNAGKLRDFAGAAAPFNIKVANLSNFSSLPQVVEDGVTFEANARKKAESYSLAAPGEVVLADDSGLEVDALNGAPGVYSARYATHDFRSDDSQNKDSQNHDWQEDYRQNHSLQKDDARDVEQNAAEQNTDDEANNARVLRELENIQHEKRTARFVCVLAAAHDGKTLATFRGTAEGVILDAPRGKNGFGYDPLFYFPAIRKTFAELDTEEKSRYSHRGAAFRAFLEWYRAFCASQF